MAKFYKLESGDRSAIVLVDDVRSIEHDGKGNTTTKYRDGGQFGFNFNVVQEAIDFMNNLPAVDTCDHVYKDESDPCPRPCCSQAEAIQESPYMIEDENVTPAVIEAAQQLRVADLASIDHDEPGVIGGGKCMEERWRTPTDADAVGRPKCRYRDGDRQNWEFGHLAFIEKGAEDACFFVVDSDGDWGWHYECQILDQPATP